ncbi:hypothetical protein BAE44_0003452 [Dichanthelium oligosanthes]|uniref:Uncharacterized protein n=1 Tax=Dichanthelium oligosanthes TaxID=888268 RepID=A0A1E5WDW0_9POAL|nr:hypothetical protein BAE44_0003452 [Dichanthelium oligosanthes]
MGNLVSAGAAAVSGGGKVVMADGSVRALSEPVSVAELMMDHPRHFVVDARVLKELGRREQQHHQQQGGCGAKVAPLPADHVLGAGGVYVLLPATRGKVSAEEARRALSAARSLARSRSMPGLRRKLSSKKGHEEAASDVSAQREATTEESPEEEDEAEAARPDGFEEHRPEFLSRELSSRGWKPSLRTIEERVAPKKTPHWLF